MNFIEYIADINVPLSNSFVIHYNRKRITNIEIEKTESNILTFRFNLENGSLTEEEVKDATHQIAIDMINLISYLFNLSYKGLHTSVFCRNGKKIQYGRATFSSFATLQIIGDNTLQIKEKFKDKSLLQELRNNPYHSMLREILSVNHTLSKYLLLYSLIYLISEDNQNRVETFIKGNEPNVEMMERIKSNGTTEYKSVYTTLRNRIGHMNKDETIDNLTKDMSRTLNGLIRLAKLAVEETHSNNN
jgi:hypothetical protein